MIKKSLIVVFLILCLNIELLAKNSRLALEMARSNQIDQVVKRVNYISSFINLFIMETGAIPSNANSLNTQYPGMGFDNINNISFSISNNIITFTNIIRGLSTISNQLFQNNTNWHPLASILPNNNVLIPLSAESIKFLGKINTIESLDDDNILTGNILINNLPPMNDCNVLADLGKIWYRPDFSGAFINSFCENPGDTNLANRWTIISNNLNISIIRDSKSLLETIHPPRGTIGYSRDTNTSTLWHEYIYSGEPTPNGWKRVQ